MATGNKGWLVRWYKARETAAHQALPAKNKNDLNLILYLNNLSYSYFRDGQEDKAMVVISQAVDQLEKLSIKNDNKLFTTLLTTLIEIVEKL